MSDAREAVLGRIRAALGPAPAVPEVPRAYRQASDTANLAELFCERAADYRVTVRRVREAECEAVLPEACEARGARRLAAAPGIDLNVDGIELLADEPPLSPLQLDALDGVVTGCALAIAETGTIVLDGSEACGRRALTLVPDYHLCIVYADQVLAGVPEAIMALQAAARDGCAITFISGPSATSDIELERVEGVHGPRTLDIVLVTNGV